MSTRELVAAFIEDNPDMSAQAIAKQLRADGVTEVGERTLRKHVAAILCGNTSCTVPDPSKPHPCKVVTGDVTTESVSSNAKSLSYKGTRSITSLEEAIEFFEIDTHEWSVARWTCNSWDSGDKTNYQVKVQLVRIAPEDAEVSVVTLQDAYKAAVSKVKKRKAKGRGTGVAVLSDFHIGAKVEDMLQTDDFSYAVVVDRLNQAAEQINRLGYKNVEVALLGDFIETFTGLNHMNSWQQLEYGGFGANVTIMAYKIMRDFLSQINNLGTVSIVSGNHDRVSVKNDVDAHGGVAQLLAFMLTQSGLDIKFEHSIISKDIDGIQYLFTHNHLGLSKGDMVQTFWEYGTQGKYNVMLGGHWHSRRGKAQYKKIDNIHWDQANYRSISVAPIFTGNWYSESNGWSSTSGITILENNGDGRPNVFDFTLQ